MKKLAVLMMVAALLNGAGAPGCTHVHDEDCGYDPITGEGCTHECDDDCYEVMPMDGGCLFCQD